MGFDPAGPTHIATNHTDRTRLAAHAAVARRCRDTEYGPLPERMRLIVLPISIFGAIGSSGQAFIDVLSHRMHARHDPTFSPPPRLLGDTPHWPHDSHGGLRMRCDAAWRPPFTPTGAEAAREMRSQASEGCASRRQLRGLPLAR